MRLPCVSAALHLIMVAETVVAPEKIKSGKRVSDASPLKDGDINALIGNSFNEVLKDFKAIIEQ